MTPLTSTLDIIIGVLENPISEFEEPPQDNWGVIGGYEAKRKPVTAGSCGDWLTSLLTHVLGMATFRRQMPPDSSPRSVPRDVHSVPARHMVTKMQQPQMLSSTIVS
jgi:hypothetical protein